ncbi:MAG: hypothetical protein DRQ78_07620 [Epsilonproteobacteria bacterium]|nr:MAG: hypothetical protein DRQ78_07620 [Campylobacterota bacterium]
MVAFKEIVCENRNCTKVMFAIRFKYYCSDKCKIDQQKFELRQRKKDEKILVPKQKIKPVFLVRGNISGVHYK